MSSTDIEDRIAHQCHRDALSQCTTLIQSIGLTGFVGKSNDYWSNIKIIHFDWPYITSAHHIVMTSAHHVIDYDNAIAVHQSLFISCRIAYDHYLSHEIHGFWCIFVRLSTRGITPWHILCNQRMIILAFRWLGLGGHRLNRSWTWWHYGRAGDAGMTHHGVTGRQSRKSNTQTSSPSSDTRSNGTRSRNGNRYTLYIIHWNLLTGVAPTQVSHWSRSPRSSTASWEFGSGSCDHATLTDMPNSSWSNVINGRSCPQSYAWQASDITALLTSSSSTWEQCVAYDDQGDIDHSDSFWQRFMMIKDTFKLHCHLVISCDVSSLCHWMWILHSCWLL